MSISVDIKKKLGDFTLDIEFESSASRIGILGASGSGKSLTLKSIAGIENPEEGRIVAGGRVLFDSSSKIDLKPQKRNVGYMFQNYALFPTMTVEDNIAAALKYGGRSAAEEVSDMIERFGLQGLEKHLPGQLSGGQQQRVALARIMVYSPPLILLDEPFSALDQHLRERLQHEMRQMLEDYPGQVVMVSHSRDEIYRFADDLIIIDEGKVVAFGKTQKIFEEPGTSRVARITGCKNITPAVRTGDHTLKLPLWETELKLEGTVPDGVDSIGYRAHFFEPVWGEREENCIPFRLSGVDDLPFERRYYVEAAGGGEKICWFVQKGDRGRPDMMDTPDFLKLREDDIMFLEDERNQ